MELMVSINHSKMACLSSLPEDCVSRILSLTSPRDACRMLAVSKQFRSPADSNVVWNKFLPTDSHHIILSSPASISLSNSSSKKELFFLLSNSIIVDDGNKAFALEKSSGRKSYILSARELLILSSNWAFKFHPESRFGEVGELKAAERIEMEGKIRSEDLSPNTIYGAYLLFKITHHAYGLDSIPCETFIASGDRVLTTNTATLYYPRSINHSLYNLFYGNRLQKMRERVGGSGGAAACKREDGWLEIEVGEFFVSGGVEEIRMGVMEIKGFQLKEGLIVEGIEVRPKPLNLYN